MTGGKVSDKLFGLLQNEAPSHLSRAALHSCVAAGTELQLLQPFASYPGFLLAPNHVFCSLLDSFVKPVSCRLAQQQTENPKENCLRCTLVLLLPLPCSPLSPSLSFLNSMNIYRTRASAPASASDSE